MSVHLVLWSLAESQATLDELRARLPPLDPPSAWISHGPSERFGFVAHGELPDLAPLVELIGGPPAVVEEFEVEP